MITDTHLTRKRMITGQIFTNRVSNQSVLAALEIIPRENFVPENYKKSAYCDAPIPLGGGREMLEPLAIARILQAAKISSGDRVLVVDCDTGYSAALVSQLAKKVFAVEEDAELLRRAKNNITNIKIANVEVSAVIPNGVFDVIIMNGAVEIVPDQLLVRLSEKGRLVAIRDGFVDVIIKSEKRLLETKGDQVFAAVLPDFKKKPGFVF